MGEMVVADVVMDRNGTGAAIWNKHVVSTAPPRNESHGMHYVNMATPMSGVGSSG